MKSGDNIFYVHTYSITRNDDTHDLDHDSDRHIEPSDLHLVNADHDLENSDLEPDPSAFDPENSGLDTDPSGIDPEHSDSDDNSEPDVNADESMDVDSDFRYMMVQVLQCVEHTVL